MNERRRKLVLKAFNKLDKDHSGTLDINDIRGVYNCDKHPDVASGKKTEDEVLQEFLQTFEVHHNTQHGGQPDSFVTKEEFIEYYNNVSMSIDNDQYFELMMNNAWKINEGDRTYGKGWAGENAQKPSFNQQRPGTTQRIFGGNQK